MHVSQPELEGREKDQCAYPDSVSHLGTSDYGGNKTSPLHGSNDYVA